MAAPEWLVRALAFDRARLRPAAGARAGLGVLVPLVVGVVAGHPAAGAQAAAGALPVGVAAMTGTFGPPTALLIGTTAGMAVSTFVGSLVAGHAVPMVALLTLWGFAAGLMVALGRPASIVGVQAVVAFVVFGRYPGGVAQSAAHAGWVVAGGSLQLLFAHLLRPARVFDRERQAIASAHDALAGLARGVLDGASGAAAGDAIAEAATLVARRSADETDGVDALRGLVDESRRIRLEIQSLSVVPVSSELRAAVDAAADWLQMLAEAVRRGDAPGEEPTTLSVVVDELRRHRATTNERFAAARVSALLGQLRASHRLAALLAGVRRLPLPSVAGLRSSIDLTSRAGGMLRRLRVAAEPGSPELRHAVRLAALLAVAEVVARLLPWQHTWWVTLTTVVVLKPDYAATAQRGVGRVAGTAAGVLVGGLVVGGLHPHDLVLAALVGGFAAASYAVFTASFAVYTFFLTGVVVLLVSTFDPRPLAAVVDRGLDTLVGGALALAGYALWPTREAATLRATTRALLDALATYADTVLSAYIDAESVSVDALTTAGRAVRRARADAQASLDRAAAEPPRLRGDTETAASVLAAARRIVVTLHSLRATVQDSAEPVAVPELASMKRDIVSALRSAAEEDVPAGDLREAQQRLQDAVDPADAMSWHGRRLALAVAHLDPLVDGIHTIQDMTAAVAAPVG
ncbi:MAG TPA: FUSC family protein [Mycobacteriales bacterium]|nr:FUSC family protein [Mycobacteriales bacterium]